MGSSPDVRVSNSNCRIFSPVAVPPGSLVVTNSRPCSRSLAASRSSCVLLPHPSRPSNVMNVPRRVVTLES